MFCGGADFSGNKLSLFMTLLHQCGIVFLMSVGWRWHGYIVGNALHGGR